MTAADRREELEALLWRYRLDAVQVGRALILADAYATAARPRARVTPAPGRPPLPRQPPAVHYAPAGDRSACLPYELFESRSRQRTADPAKVTCGHCRKKITAAAEREGRAA